MSRRQEVRLRLLSHMPKGGVAAEIGVWDGGFSRVILEETDARELHLIDPWLYQPEFSNTMFGRPKNADRMEGMYEQVRASFEGDARVTLHRAMSEEAMATFPDDYFDWVYIDGNHNEPFVSKDLELSFRKVRPGGVIAGDDYYWNGSGDLPVRSAVTRFRDSFRSDAEFRLFGQQFMISLPEPKPARE